MTYTTIAPPLGEPLTLVDAKAHLRLDGSDEDALLLSLIKTARAHLERTTGLALMSQTLRLYLDAWPQHGAIEIARGPVTAIETVTVYDANGVAIDLPLAGHRLDGTARPARLRLPPGSAAAAGHTGVEVDFTAGFGATGADVPDTLKRAMLLHIGHMFAFRGVVSPELQPASLPAGYEALVAPFRIVRL